MKVRSLLLVFIVLIPMKMNSWEICQQNSLFYSERWRNVVQSDWEKGSLKRASRRTGYSMQATLGFIEQEICAEAG